MTVALAVIPSAGPYWAGVLLMIAALVYFVVPAESRPQAAATYERIPAVIGPDLLAFLLVPVFGALPFWARAGEPYLWSDFGLLVHPSSLLSWPLALVAAAIPWFSANYASFWLLFERDGLTINRLAGKKFVHFSDISMVEPLRRGLPGWLRGLTPILAALGKYQAAGAILLARDSTGITIRLVDGSRIDIHREGFEKPFKRLVRVLHENDVAFAQYATDAASPRGATMQ